MRVLRPIELGRTIHELSDNFRLNGIRMAERELSELEDYWHVVGQPGEPAFENGWANYVQAGLDANPLSYFRDNSGVVHLRGLIANTAATNDDAPGGNTEMTTIFTLPVGWRPFDGQYHLAMGNLNYGGAAYQYTYAALYIGWDGRVTLPWRDPSLNYVHYGFMVLDNHRFWVTKPEDHD